MIDHGAVHLACRAHLLTLSVCTTGTTNLSSTTTGYARASGSFLTDGFRVGMEVTPSGFTTTASMTIRAVDELSMTVDGTVVAQGAAGGRSLSVGLPTVRAWENVEAEPVTGQPWIEEQYLPGGAARVTMGQMGDLEGTPVYAIAVRTALGIGTAALRGYTDALITHFAPDTPLTIADGTLTVRGQPVPAATPATRGETWLASQVSVALRYRTTNSR